MRIKKVVINIPNINWVAHFALKRLFFIYIEKRMNVNVQIINKVVKLIDKTMLTGINFVLVNFVEYSFHLNTL